MAHPQEPERNWLLTTIEIIGLPKSWTRRPQLSYTDPQLYPLHPSADRAAEYRRIDTVLTKDGKRLLPIKVQAVESLKNEPNSTWQRHSINNVNTVARKISKLPLTGQARFKSIYAKKSWATPVSWAWCVFLWIITIDAHCIWFICLLFRHVFHVFFPGFRKTPELNYLDFFYEDSRYPRVASNPTDNRKLPHRIRYEHSQEYVESTSYGLIRPRMLVRTDKNSQPQLVQDFRANVKYVFIAFSFSHFPLDDKNRQTEVVRVANKVTQQLGYEYFWISASCMGLSEAEKALPELERRRIEEKDIYGISDVIRGASQVLILLPDLTGTVCPKLRDLLVDDAAIDPNSAEACQAAVVHLKEWGARVWTFPEVLLGPDLPIRICWKDNFAVHWFELEKQHFPGSVWEDRRASMHMVQHYKNTALTRLEFIKIAMDCLLHRQQEGIQWHYPGDLSYVLMGFLRIRPPINKYDSSLQAFARLSLPADNDRLMERVVCLQSPSRGLAWSTMTDEFKADLWNIEPYIQISGVGENDTIIIEKAFGARIEMAKFTDVSAVRLGYLRRLEGVTAGMTMIPDLAASMERHFARFKYREVYPRLFGFEGFMKLEEIEEKLFGAPVGLLSWSKNTSTLSRHKPGNPAYEPKLGLSRDQGRKFAGLQLNDDAASNANVDLEARNGVAANRRVRYERDSIEGDDGRIKTYPMVGRQPWQKCNCTARADDDCNCPHWTDRKLRKMGRNPMGKDKIFTLIDTRTMTATLLKAAWPPQALIACGTEGGMERVLACSYDWTTGVFYKESVLRLPGKVLEYMHRLPGIRLGLERTLETADVALDDREAGTAQARPGFR